MAELPAGELMTAQQIADELGYEHQQTVTTLWTRHRKALEAGRPVADPFPDAVVNPDDPVWAGWPRLWRRAEVIPWGERNPVDARRKRPPWGDEP